MEAVLRKEKRFEEFGVGIVELGNISYSVKQVLEEISGELSPENVTRKLYLNLDWFRGLKQAGDPELEIKMDKNSSAVRYTTSGGLAFGWSITENEKWTFFIACVSVNGTLAKAFKDFDGWEEALAI